MLTKGKGKRRCLKEKKKEEKVDRADGDRRKYTFSFPVRTLKFELEKKRSSLRLAKKSDEWENFRQTEVTGECKEKTVEMRT